MSLIKVADSVMSQVLTREVQGADHFIWIFRDGSNISVPLGVGFEFDAQYSVKGRFLPEGTSIHYDWQ